MKLAHREDCTILRGKEGNPGFAMLIDCDGDEIFSVPETWTDNQVWEALDIANRVFSKGIDAGKAMKASEIRRALAC